MIEVIQYYDEEQHRRIGILEESKMYLWFVAIDYPVRAVKLQKSERRHMKDVQPKSKTRLKKTLKRMLKYNGQASQRTKHMINSI